MTAPGAVPPSADLPGDRIPAWAPPAILGVVFVALAAWSWRRWADPIVDFGNEPYLSWQLLEGRGLYRDLTLLYGPLAPWVNALWFELFGVSLATLAWCNLAIAATLAAVVYRFCVECADRLTGLVAVVVLLASFVFPHHAEDAANYNFIWPYGYAATHGAVLLVCGVVALSRAVVSDRAGAWACGGLLLGMTLLTKAEIAAAAAMTGGVAALLRLTDGRAGRLRALAALVAAALVPALLCWALLGTDAVVAPWVAAARVAGGERFNAHLLGTDDLAGNLARVGIRAGLWTLVAAGLIWVDLRSVRMADAHRRWCVIGGVALVGALLVHDLPGVGRPLPALIPMAVAALVWLIRRRPAARDRLAPLVLLGAAAWTLLGRMLLNVHFHHYGFYLAMPAAVFVVLLGVGTLPRLLAERVAGGGRVVRSVTLAAIGCLLVYSLGLSAASYGHMTVPVGRDRDAMLGPSTDVSPTGALAVAMLARIAADVPAGATLAVLPDGSLLNFLARRPNPTPFNEVMPPLLLVYGTDRVLEAYEAHPPQYVVLYDWPGEEYGVGTFGTSSWGAEIVAWVERRYDRIDAVASSGATIGFSVWRRRG